MLRTVLIVEANDSVKLAVTLVDKVVLRVAAAIRLPGLINQSGLNNPGIKLQEGHKVSA